jgi:2-polyprenyl-6-methoxyphenol hydroxylase-like FAD-dependent oxidoreductase
MDPLHVIIIGAGYGGLALAHGLRRAAVSCAVYEAQCRRTHTDRSMPTLHQLLLTGQRDRVHFGKEFRLYERQADGTVIAFFADGSRAAGQVLVAADGTHSAVRAQYLPQAVPQPPVPAWRPSNITLLGDAIHPVTPGQRVNPNIALRDALLLSHALAAVQAGRVGLVNAIAAYECEMKRSCRAGADGSSGSRARGPAGLAR